MSRSGKGSRTRRSALDRQRSLARALRPGIEPLRQLILAGNLPEPAERAFQELKLNPSDETDWKVLASALAIHLFSDDRPRRRQAWTNFQLIHLLWEVHKRKQNNDRLSDERICLFIAQDQNSPSYFRVGLRGKSGKGSGLVKKLQRARDQFQNISAAFPLAFRKKLSG